MNNKLASVVIFFAGLICGCNDSAPGRQSSDDYVELMNRQTNGVEVGNAVVIDDLTENDVIVLVNGCPLTKRMFDERMSIKAIRLGRRKGANPSLVSAALDQFRREYVPLFVDQRLLIDAAKRLNVGVTSEINAEVDSDLELIAKKRHTTVEKIKKAFPGDFKYYLYDAAAQKWTERLIARHIPPLQVVDDEFVRKVQEQVVIDNSIARQTNELIRCEMKRWKSSIENGLITLDEIAKKYSQDESPSTNSPSYWGMFERGSIEDKNLQAKIFSLPVGIVSEPIEDDDGFHLVKVISVTPEVTNSKGRVVQHECRKVAHVYREKMPLLIRQDDKAMFADLQNQMQLQAISKYVENLRTNGENTVVYPHGEKLFR